MKAFNKFIRIISSKGFIIKLLKKVLMLRQYPLMKNFDELEKYFKDKIGLEIGGPSLFFSKNGFMPIYDKVLNLDGVNFALSTVWTGAIAKEKGYVINGKCLGKQYILDAVDLISIRKNKYDFVLSCNNIEHIANPMKAIEQWLSVLKPEGILVIVAPKKESNFDHNREIVKFEHLLNDYVNKIKEDDLTHLKEILKLHDLKMDLPAGTMEQFRERSLNNFSNRCLHQHVFDLYVLGRIYEYFNISITNKIQLYTDYVIIGQKKK